MSFTVVVQAGLGTLSPLKALAMMVVLSVTRMLSL